MPYHSQTTAYYVVIIHAQDKASDLSHRNLLSITL